MSEEVIMEIRPGDDYDEMMARYDETMMRLGSAPGAPGAGGQVAGTVTLEGRSFDLTGTLTERVTPPPPPPARRLTSLSLSPATVTAGGSSTGTVRLDAADSMPLVVTLRGAVPGVSIPASVTIPAGQVAATFPVTTATTGLVVGQIQATISASLNFDTVSAVLTINPVPVPPPPPINTLNVRDFGAKGDGITDDTAALQRALDQASGKTLFFPTGRYRNFRPLKIYKAGVQLLGEGDASVLVHALDTGVIVSPDNLPLTGITVRKMAFEGMPGLYNADGNGAAAILVTGPQGTVIEDCLFRGSSNAVVNLGNSKGTVLSNLRVNGWGSVCFFLNGGEQVKNCVLLQDDPSENGLRSSHGFYIHSAASGVLIEDTRIEKCRKMSVTIWGQSTGTETRGVTLRRLTLVGCRDGIDVEQDQPSAARVKDLLIEDCQISGIYVGAGIRIKQGDGIIVRRNRITGCVLGMDLGRWTQWEPNFSLANLRAEGNTITGSTGYGLWAGTGNGGTFQNVVVADTRLIAGNARNIEGAATPGLVLIP